jgi:methionine-rich copper-binding protein CopC
MLLAGVVSVVPAAAQVTLEEADPPPEGTVTGSPDLVSLWFDQPVDAGPGAASIEVINDTGEAQAVAPAAVYPVDPRHVNAAVRESLEPGSYTVLWTIRLAGEDAARSGAYGFRVGGNAVPGAATERDAFPALWAVITRFLTLFGLALALGGFIVAPFSSASETAGASHSSRALILVGAVLALLGTIAEPVLGALLAVPSPTLLALLGDYPTIWWLRAAALIGLLLVAIAGVLGIGVGLGHLVRIAGIVLGAIALMAVSVANVTAVRRPSIAGTEALMIALQVVVVLLTGIAIHLALAPTVPEAVEAAGPSSPPTRFRFVGSARWLLVILAIVGLLATIALGAFLLTGVSDLLARSFGWLLLGVGLLLLAILVIGVVVRAGAQAAGWSAAVLATIALAGAALLALMVPPAKAAESASLAAVSLVSPVAVDVAGEPGFAHLLYQPAASGVNAFVVWLTDPTGAVPATNDLPAYNLELHSLSRDADPITVTPAPGEASAFAIGAAELPGAGWWEADLTVTPSGGEPATAAFYLVIPDPNVHGYGPEPASSDEAEDIFTRGLTAMTSLRQVQFTTRLGGGTGTFAQTAIAIDAGGDGSPRSYHEQSAAYETIIIGDEQWLRQQGEPWSERPAGYVYVPSEWGSTYEHATGFTLGPTVEIDGEQAQVITFRLPRQEHPRQEPAWFAWWVGTETGQVHRETMISTRHYMVYNFTGFNEPVDISPPTVN